MLRILGGLGCAMALASGSVRADEMLAGKQIYMKRCASCHGENGQGDDTLAPLAGDKPLGSLADLITRTMPDGSPEECTGEDAKLVAAYIYDAFYSPEAQLRNNPPRVELSRLTVRQYENSVADLIRSFRGDGPWSEHRGLKAEYFDSRRFRNNERKIERADLGVDFDWGDDSPGEGINKDEFAIRWSGGLMAPETGDYDIILKVSGGARLWLNDDREAFIDGWVQSGETSEHRATVHLLGGRVVPLRLEFFKAKNLGKARMSLMWKRPGGVEEPIPGRFFSPNWFSKAMIVTTPFPPDDRSTGYEKATTISPEWDRATTTAALEVAAFVSQNLSDLTGLRGEINKDDVKLQEFCTRFVERAFRRPLSDEERQFFVERQIQASGDAHLAVKRVVLLTLKSPRFLYRDARVGEFDQYSLASWLSLGLWDSLPDEQLLRAAREEKLANRDELTRQAERMLADPRARQKLQVFFEHWLQFDHFKDLGKDSESYPGFDAQLLADLRTSMELYIEHHLWDESGDLRKLLLADKIPMNGRMAKFYGVDKPEGSDFEFVEFEADRRAGLLSHPYLLTGLAYHDNSSPIHRGVFIARNVLGRFLRPPPEAFTPLPAKLHPDLTTRERIDLQTKPESCRGCHSMINPLGFALENFDGVGRFRDVENERKIDATGFYVTQDEKKIEFAGAEALAKFLAESPEVHEAFVEHLFVFMIKQPMQAFGKDLKTRLEEDFAANGHNIRRLAARIVAESAIETREILARDAAPQVTARSP
jgi:hypothetical protein